MKYFKLFEQFVSEIEDFHHSDAPDAEGRFRDLGIKDLAKWLVKTRDGDMQKITGSLNQQIAFNKKSDPEYAEKMEKVRKEVKKILGVDEAQQTYDYGCVMIYFEAPKMKGIQDLISAEHLDPNEKGIEDEHHVTLLYGIHSDEVSDEDVMAAAKGFTGDIILRDASLFKNDFDVLKFEANNPTLYSCNFNLKQLPHTSSYPDYKPHATIAYLKSGKGEYYVDRFRDISITAKPTRLVYSKPDGSKIEFDFN
jgi:2'-5' RNA ligase